MTYRPDITRYQQLVYGGPTGPYDCAAWSGAILVDAHTQGKRKTTGRIIRLATDEPVPDPRSPGLNLPQVDAAVRKVTSIDLETITLKRGAAQFRIADGRWGHVQVLRSVLVDRGLGGGNGFRGGHSITVHAIAGIPYIGDPLVARYLRATWDPIWDAAEAFSDGWVRAQYTRDLTPDYRAILVPVPPAQTIRFAFYNVKDGRIVPGGEGTSYTWVVTKGSGRPRCTTPRRVRWGTSSKYVPLVQLIEGAHSGKWVHAQYAQELVP